MRLTRRRFLVAAAATALVGAARQRWEWRGSAMGAEARIVLTGPRDAAEAALSDVVAEIDRLEDIFSLQRPNSQLSRLNAIGTLHAPAQDLRATLAAAKRWRHATAGAFDPAVQPLWSHWAAGAHVPADTALNQVRHARVTDTLASITLSPGTALTLNGIAQGTIADRVTDLLVRRGFTPPLVDTGEMRLPGHQRREVLLPEAGMSLDLAEVAVATSTPGALVFDAAGRRHHLFDPSTGDSPGWWQSITVIAPDAETADALSTGFAVSPPEVAGDMAVSLGDVMVVATDRSGQVHRFGDMRMAQRGWSI